MKMRSTDPSEPQTYEFLAQALLYPDTTFAQRMGVRAQALSVPTLWASTMIDALTGETLEDLQVEHVRLFVNAFGGARCLPYESVYGEGQMLGEVAQAVANLYAEWGVEGTVELPDHAAVELAFAAHLARLGLILEGDDDRQRAAKALLAFERDHLRAWLPVLAAALRAEAELGFYRELGAALQAVFGTAEFPGARQAGMPPLQWTAGGHGHMSAPQICCQPCRRLNPGRSPCSRRQLRQATGRRACLTWLTRGSLAAVSALAIGQIARFLTFEPAGQAPALIPIGKPGDYAGGTLTYAAPARAYVGRDAGRSVCHRCRVHSPGLPGRAAGGRRVHLSLPRQPVRRRWRTAGRAGRPGALSPGPPSGPGRTGGDRPLPPGGSDDTAGHTSLILCLKNVPTSTTTFILRPFRRAKRVSATPLG